MLRLSSTVPESSLLIHAECVRHESESRKV